jgi:hypothetical protein
MRRCEDEKMFYRPPLLEEPCAQTLSGNIDYRFKKRNRHSRTEKKDTTNQRSGTVECVDQDNWHKWQITEGLRLETGLTMI